MSLNNYKQPEVTGSLSVIHRAGWVLVDPEHILANGFVKTESGKIIEVGQGRGYGTGHQVIDHGPGVLMPCLVNAHTHLELSALKYKTDVHSGFIPWVQSVIEQRMEAGEQILMDGISSGIDELMGSGSLIVGDIASLEISRQPFLNSTLSGVRFLEFLGSDFGKQGAVECEKISQDKTISIAGHAPHTTASDLLICLKANSRSHGLPFSIHLAESSDEVEFLNSKKGAWADFLLQRKIDTSAMKVTGASPVKYTDQLGILDEKTLAVHLVFADKNDIQIISERNVNVCICPRSNHILHGKLPDVPLMIRHGLNLCLGTDSLASNTSLSLFDEMEFLSHSFSDISPVDIIAMATINGSSALGFKNQFGKLTPGSLVKMIYLPINGNSTGSILESIVSGDFSGEVKTIFN